MSHKETAEQIIVALHAKWISDEKNDGTYTLDLTEHQTKRFFDDLSKMIEEVLERPGAQVEDRRLT